MVNLGKFNRHWQDDFLYSFERKRALFPEILKYLGKRQIIALTGLRRTGKTVLMKQAINHLIKSNIPRKNIFYFSFDEQRLSIDELVGEYAGATGASLERDRLFIFLDEVQKIANWQEQVKTYYDNYENIKFFVSGSASLFIEKRATESLAGRVYTIELPVLSFREFLAFRDKAQFVENPKMFLESLKQEFLLYARRNFIEIINEDNETSNAYVEGIVNKVVFEDIPSLFPVDSPEKLKAMAQAIYSRPGMLINYESLGSDLGMSAKTAEKYLSYLVRSKLVKKLYNYSKNFLTSEKKAKKAYIVAPCMCFLNDSADFSKVAENIVAVGKGISFFWRSPQKDEIDFITKKGGKAFPIESKYSEKPTSSDFRAIKKFLEKNRSGEALVITKDETKFDAPKGIKQMPLWEYCLGPEA